jgi:hypothetical protein
MKHLVTYVPEGGQNISYDNVNKQLKYDNVKVIIQLLKIYESYIIGLNMCLKLRL